MIYYLKSIKEITTQTAKDMVEVSKGPKKIKSLELVSRFSSKEDLYRYLT
jgi:hypothetical protein